LNKPFLDQGTGKFLRFFRYGKNKAASPQPPLEVDTVFKSVQGGKKKLNRFVHAHLRFRVLNTKKSQGQSNHFFAV